MGMADLAATLYLRHLRFDPQDTGWKNRDRIVFSDLARGSSLSVSEDASGNYTTTVSATEVADGVTITTSDAGRTATATNLAGSSTVTFQNNLDAVPYTGVDDSVDSWLTMVGLAGAAAGIAMALLAFVRRRSRSEGVQ